MEDPWLLHIQFAYPLSKSTKMLLTCRVRDTLETLFLKHGELDMDDLWLLHVQFAYPLSDKYIFIVQDAWNSRNTLPNMIYDQTFRIITGHPYGDLNCTCSNHGSSILNPPYYS
jgi:hypothetical protein